MRGTKGVVFAIVAAIGVLAGALVAEPAWARVPCPDGSIDPTTGTCVRGGGSLGGDDGADGSDGGGGGDGDEEGADGPARPPTRAEVEAAVQYRLVVNASSLLLQPTVSFDTGDPEVAGGDGDADGPDVDVDAHVGIATFVEVTNWQGQQIDQYDETDPYGTTWWIQITATPHLSFDPGEPGASIVRCEDGGTAYDPDGPSLAEQASRPGACAYAYTMRTGADGRPDEWSAEVTVDWTLEWDANFPLPSGLPTSARLVAPVPRQVGEISTVVVED